MRIGSLFSGAGGLDMAVEAVFGGHTVWHSEIDKAASKVLAHRWPDVPNLGSITEIDWATVEPVDVLCGGWPCQPWSIAGSKKGAEDDRALWPHVEGAIRGLRPGIVVLENVPNIIVLGELARAVGSLATLGYDAQWACLRASEIGAPHRRERIFILATDANNPRWGEHCRSIAASQELPAAQYLGYFTDEVNLLPTPKAAERGDCQSEHNRNDPDLRAATYHFPDGVWGSYESAVRQWENVLNRPAPRPTEPNSKGGPRLSAEFASWLMGWPAGWVTDPAIGISRNDQLRIVGNGVCTQQAIAALRYLLAVAT